MNTKKATFYFKGSFQLHSVFKYLLPPHFIARFWLLVFSLSNVTKNQNVSIISSSTSLNTGLTSTNYTVSLFTTLFFALAATTTTTTTFTTIIKFFIENFHIVQLLKCIFCFQMILILIC